MIVKQFINETRTVVFPIRPNSGDSDRLSLQEFWVSIVGKKVQLKEARTIFGDVLLVRCGQAVYCPTDTFHRNWVKNLLCTLAKSGQIQLFEHITIH